MFEFRESVAGRNVLLYVLEPPDEEGPEKWWLVKMSEKIDSEETPSKEPTATVGVWYRFDSHAYSLKKENATLQKISQRNDSLAITHEAHLRLSVCLESFLEE